MRDSGTEDHIRVPQRIASSGATIIAFPSRPRPVAAVWQGDTDAALARLDRALLKLNRALVEQHAALKAWRQASQVLAGSVAVLSERFRRLDDQLGSLRIADD